MLIRNKSNKCFEYLKIKLESMKLKYIYDRKSSVYYYIIKLLWCNCIWREKRFISPISTCNHPDVRQFSTWYLQSFLNQEFVISTMIFTFTQIERATGQRIKDLTKPPKNSVPYTSTAARSKKVIKMQNRYARARPVPKGTKVPGIEDESTQVPFFLPSEKPAGKLLDPHQ